MRQIISRIIKWITGFKSGTYAVVYLISIPSFALLYASMPFHFYHSTIKHEPLFEDEKLKLAESIKKYLQSNYDNNIKPKLVSRYTAVPTTVEIFVDHVEYNESQDAISFKTGIIPLNTTGARDTLDTFLTCDVTVLKYENRRIGPKFYLTQYRYPIEVSRVEIGSASFPWIDEKIIFGEKWNGSYYLDNLPDDLRDKFGKFVATAKGLPRGMCNNIVRMTYFSIVTITTLGYGDIAPVSSLARILVGVESVWGVVVIGLFLNSLSAKRGGGSALDSGQ